MTGSEEDFFRLVRVFQPVQEEASIFAVMDLARPSFHPSELEWLVNLKTFMLQVRRPHVFFVCLQNVGM